MIRKEFQGCVLLTYFFNYLVLFCLFALALFVLVFNFVVDKENLFQFTGAQKYCLTLHIKIKLQS